MAIEINVPPLGESITEATVGPWKKQAGDVVAMDELLCELETDKVTVEINAPAAGRLVEIVAPAEAVVELGARLAVIDETDTDGANAGGSAPDTTAPATTAPKEALAPVQEAEKPAAEADGEADAPAPASSADLSPAVRKLVAEHDLDPARIKGTGKDGRILKGDVLQAIEAGSAVKVAAPAAAPLAGASAATEQVPASRAEREKRVKMTRLRQRVAERLKDAQNTAAMLTTFNEVDMTEMMAARTHYRDLFEKKHGVRLGFMSFFVKACVVALKEIPAVNAEIQGDELVYKNYYDIGVAVGTPRGLVVPVLRDADTRGFADVEKGITDLGLRARDGKLTMDDLNGGTFTISNGGVYGSLMSTPILNPPQSGILGMHKIQDRPVAIDGKVEIRPMMYLALSYDHRIIDGREAVTFLVRVKECLEDPQRILLDL